jgi:hypothetical protein
MENFLQGISAQPDLALKDFGLEGLGVLNVVATLRDVYKLSEQEGTGD